MGITHSAIQNQIVEVLNHNEQLYAFPDLPFYQKDHVKRYNLDLWTKPVAITYPKTNAQVSAIVKLAAKAGLKVQGRSGGHSYANYSSPDGGIVIDLKNFQQFSIDTTSWFATVGAGTLLGDLDKRLHDPHKRAIAHGTCPQVGIGGHATIGGLGPASRLYGSALDHVEEVEAVVADGSIIRASKIQNEDLFWAFRGAGASFGVITEFVVHTHPAPEELVQFGAAFTHGSWNDMASAFKTWQKFVLQPDLTWKFASTATIIESGLSISATFFGTEEEFNELAKLPNFPITAQVETTVLFRDWLTTLEHWAVEVAVYFGGGVPAHSYTKTLTFNIEEPIPEPVIDKIFDYVKVTKKDTPVWFIIFDLAGGQTNAIPMESTSYAHRDALFYLQAYAISLQGSVKETTKDFLRGLNKMIVEEMASVGETTDFGAYAGYVDPQLLNGQQKYWRMHLPRLERIKAEYDPHDIFHNWQSVRPSGNDVLGFQAMEKRAAKSPRLWTTFRRRLM